MITPSYGLTATERVLPRLALDWTTGLAQTGVDVTRAGVATFVGSNGLIQSASVNTQRIDYSTGTSGLLVEESRTNALLNSLIDGTSLATQLVTVTAVARTLSFYGTGTIVLSGAHSATAVGDGAYPTRTILTFTPSAGVLTLTVTGTVQFAQLEIGVFPTSYIPTAATEVTRNADAATMTGTNFSDWYNPTEGTFSIDCIINTKPAGQILIEMRGGTSANRFQYQRDSSSNTLRYLSIVSSSITVNLTKTSTFVNDVASITSAYKLNNYGVAVNGGVTTTDTSGGVPVVDRMRIGATVAGTAPSSGWYQKLLYYPQRLTNAEIQAFSK